MRIIKAFIDEMKKKRAVDLLLSATEEPIGFLIVEHWRLVLLGNPDGIVAEHIGKERYNFKKKVFKNKEKGSVTAKKIKRKVLGDFTIEIY